MSFSPTIFLGNTSAPDAYISNSYYQLGRWVSRFDGFITQLVIYSQYSTNAKVGFYRAAGTGTRLWYTDSPVSFSPGFNVVDITPVEVEINTTGYEIGAITEVNNALGFSGSGTFDRSYLATTYAAFSHPATLSGFTRTTPDSKELCRYARGMPAGAGKSILFGTTF